MQTKADLKVGTTVLVSEGRPEGRHYVPGYMLGLASVRSADLQVSRDVVLTFRSAVT